MFKRYYSELYQKFYVTSKNLSLFLFCSGEKMGFFSGPHPFFEHVSLGGSFSNNEAIDQSISTTIQGANKISLTKNIAIPEQNIQTNIEATKTNCKKLMIWFGQSLVILSNRRVTSILRRRVCLK